MASQRILRSEVALHIARIANTRGDAPVLIVPGLVEEIDMAQVVRDLTAGMGYDSITMRVCFWDLDSAYFGTPEESGLIPANHGRLYVIDDRQPRDPGKTATADEMIAAVVKHIDAAGGIRSPIIVISRHGVEGVRDQALLLGRMTGLPSTSLYAVL